MSQFMASMDGVRVGVAGNPAMQDAATGCTDARCALVVSVVTEGKQTKLSVSMEGSRFKVIEVVAQKAFAGHIVAEKIVAVAPKGSYVGEVLAPRPMLLSAHHLGWKGGSNGSAVVLPASCAIGDTAPSEKPKRTEDVFDGAGNKVVQEGMESLYVMKKKKPTREEKAAAKAAKREAIRQAKIAAGELPEDEEVELQKATKGQLKKIKSAVKAKRDAGEECTTDDELEAAGFLAQ